MTDGEPAERDHILRPSAEVGAMFNINLEHGSQSAVDAKPKNQKGPSLPPPNIRSLSPVLRSIYPRFATLFTF